MTRVLAVKVITLLLLWPSTACLANSHRSPRPPRPPRTRSSPTRTPSRDNAVVQTEEIMPDSSATAGSSVEDVGSVPTPTMAQISPVSPPDGPPSVTAPAPAQTPADAPSTANAKSEPIPAVVPASLPGMPVAKPTAPGDRRAANISLEAPPGPAVDDGDAEEGDLRIVDRVDVNGFVTGALQVFFNGAFGAVCSKAFDAVDADVACRQMGFVGGTSIDTAIARTVPEHEQQEQVRGIRAPMVLENLDCSGTEMKLVDCPGAMDDVETVYTDYGVSAIRYSFVYYGEFHTYCDPARGTYAFVACGQATESEEGDVRLAGGAVSESSEYGRLEIFSGGGWGAVCNARFRQDVSTFVDVFDARFTEAAISVACRQLGYAAGAITVLPQDTRSPEARRIPIVLPGAAGCTGSEASLLECPGVDLVSFDNQCGLRELVSITCFNDLDPVMEGSLRLIDGQEGASFEYGRLEIFLRGFWSNICDNSNFSPDSASVACRLLGYDGGAALKFQATFGPPSSDFPEEVGFESRILEDQVLVGNLPVGLASVDCDGTETSLLQCSSSQDDIPGCRVLNQNFTDSTVLACANSNAECDRQPEPTTGSVRLRGGFGSLCDDVYTGFVEVFNFGEWGAVCDSQAFGVIEDRLIGDVVCRQLGFPHGSTIDPTANSPDPGPDEYTYLPFGVFRDYDNIEEAEEQQARFWLNGVTCRGPEERLVDCDLGAGFQQDNAGCSSPVLRVTVACRTFPIVEALESVTTPAAEEGDLRLAELSAVGGWQMGRLEVFFENSWSQVCAVGFGSADADVACRQLGFGSGTTASSLAALEPPPDVLVSPEAALTFSGCNGTESRLIDCSLEDVDRFLPSECFSDVNAGLRLACVANPDDSGGGEGSVRLTDGGILNGDGVSAGILEIFHDGAWGTVCSNAPQFQITPRVDIMNQGTAGVICRELGFQSGIAQLLREVPDTYTILPPWLIASRRVCSGGEAAFSECGPFSFGDTLLCGPAQRLVCVDPGSTGGSSEGQARLVGGRADPGGAWEYGRLQVFRGSNYAGAANNVFGGFFSALTIGRREAHVACRSLGYETGVVLRSGALSGLPGDDNTLFDTEAIGCSGLEQSLGDCTTDTMGTLIYDDDVRTDSSSVALLCSTTSGCPVEEPTPTQGDVRLVDFQGVNSTTRPCDDVHFGGVEFFNDGQWGRVCVDIDLDPAQPTVSANVICRQLGFPFGDLIESARSGVQLRGPSAFISDYDEEDAVVWATEVQCTGTEERLDECFFPQQFNGFTRSITFPVTPIAEDDVGIQRAICSTNPDLQVGVICRRFEIEESEVIR